MPHADPEVRKAYMRAYRQRNADKIRGYCRAWAARDPDHAKALQKARELKHRLANPEDAKERRERYVRQHPEREAARHRRYRRENPEEIRAKKHRRRARELKCEGRFTAREWQALQDHFGNRCLRCGTGGKLQPDHVVPLARGGANTIDNIQPLCKSCNVRKGAKTIDYRGRP